MLTGRLREAVGFRWCYNSSRVVRLFGKREEKRDVTWGQDWQRAKDWQVINKIAPNRLCSASQQALKNMKKRKEKEIENDG